MAIQLSGFKSIAAFGAATLEMIAIDFDGVKLVDYHVMRFVTASSAYQAQLFLNGLMMHYRTYQTRNRGVERLWQIFFDLRQALLVSPRKKDYATTLDLVASAVKENSS
jgi:hypothetical protein